MEINPLILTKDGKVIALDGKINFDDNAMYRHKDILEYRDLDEEDPSEVEASKYELNYIKLPNGTIGSMVNGAGLAMATWTLSSRRARPRPTFLTLAAERARSRWKTGFGSSLRTLP